MEILLTCVKIFAFRTLDVTLATINTVLTVKGKVLLSSIVGFIDVFIWYIVIKDALTGNGPAIFMGLAYAGGYALGVLIGGYISKRFVKGQVTVQAILPTDDDTTVNALRKIGYGISVVEMQKDENQNRKLMISSTIDKKQKGTFLETLRTLEPDAFITVHQTEEHYGGYNRAKILSNDDYASAMIIFSERKKKHGFINDQKILRDYQKLYSLNYAEAVVILKNVKKDIQKINPDTK